MTEEQTQARPLAPHHAELIRTSAISDEVRDARGYWTAAHKWELRDLGFGKVQQRVPALVIPIRGVTGELVLHQIRPDEPRRAGDGRTIKYETPSRARMALDVPPIVRPMLGNPQVPLIVTEGARKADSAASIGLCCIALAGVWNWRGSNGEGGTTALPDWEHVALNGRAVYLAFDSDITAKPAVRAAMLRLKSFLGGRGAEGRIVYLPSGPNGEKVGLDDYLAAGHGRDELFELAGSRPPAPPPPERDHPYRAEPYGLVYEKPTRDGSVDVPLCNFTARIVREVVEDDGAEQRRLFELEARLKGRPFAFEIPAAGFRTMDWVTENLGAEAIVAVGTSMRDHARAAVQHLSGSVPIRNVFTHTGWRRIGGRAVYLHAGGALGPLGPVADVETRLDGGLARFLLAQPPDGEALRDAVRSSLAVLELAPHRVTVPLLALVYRAPLGAADLSGWLVGPSGAGKSELAALAQQHYGAGMDRLHLPASWSSTGNALEAIAFQAADALLVVDDFAPTGSTADVQRLHREAERLLRAQGNASARQRMRADTTLRPPRPPRGLLLGTGEDTPRGQSLRARLVVVEVGPGDLDWTRLGPLQERAGSGELAAAMAGYLRWLAPLHDDDAERLRTRFRELRQLAQGSATHRRTPAAIANLALGFERLVEFAEAVGALDAEERLRLWERCWRALGELGVAQADHLRSAEPTVRFLELLRAALASGEAHLAAPTGEKPAAPGSWGWRMRIVGAQETWEPQGRRMGWLDGENVYLEPESAFAVCQRLGQTIGEPLTVAVRTLETRLRERGLLASVEVGQRGGRFRVSGLEGKRRPVLHFLSPSLFPEPAQSAQPAQDGAEGPSAEFNGAGGWAESWAETTASGEQNCPANCPTGAHPEFNGVAAGQVGQVGQIPEEEGVREWRA